MTIIEILKGYNGLVTDIQMLESEKIIWREMLNSGNYKNYDVERKQNTNYVNDGITYSVVEKEFFRKFADNKLKIDDIKERLRNIESALKWKNNLLDKIKILLEYLSDKEMYLIKLLYFDRLDWKNVVENYNKKYRKYYISENGLKMKKHKAFIVLKEKIKNTILWEIDNYD